MARIAHLVEIAIGREASMICIDNGRQGRACLGNGHREAEVSDGDEPAKWIPWTAFPRRNAWPFRDGPERPAASLLRVARDPTEAARLAAASRPIVADLVRERANRRTTLVSVGSQNGTGCES
jgi:hypothetical protein